MPVSTSLSPSRWLVRYVAAVITAATPVVLGAIAVIVAAPPSPKAVVGAALFGVGAIACELKPVPVGEHGSRYISLSFVFLLAALLAVGWQYAVLSAVAAAAVVGLWERTPTVRWAFNAA